MDHVCIVLNMIYYDQEVLYLAIPTRRTTLSPLLFSVLTKVFRDSLWEILGDFIIFTQDFEGRIGRLTPQTILPSFAMVCTK